MIITVTSGDTASRVTVASGTRGPEGPQGPAGTNGTNGINGVDGQDGAPGAKGDQGDPGPGVAAGGTAGQILSKVDATDYNTEWVDAATGGASDAADVTFTPAGTIAAADVQAALEELDGDTRMSNARTPTAHAASHQDGGSDELALDGSQITTGTVADARVAATIARDTEVTAAVAAEATARDGAIATHSADTTSVHGITDTSALETTTGSQAKVDAHVNDTTAAHAASAVSFSATGGIASTDVQAAVAELDTEKSPLASPTFTGTPAGPTAPQGTNTTQLATTAYVQTEAGLLIPKSLVDAKGDLLVGSADNTVIRKAVGTDGQVLTADAASTGGVKWADAAGGGGAAVGCRAYRSAAQAMAAATVTPIPFDAESWDTGTLHDNSSNPTRITVPSAGKYLVTGRIAFGVTSGQIQARFNKNGSLWSLNIDTASATDQNVSHTDVLDLAAGDYIELAAYQASGTTGLSVGQTDTWLAVIKYA